MHRIFWDSWESSVRKVLAEEKVIQPISSLDLVRLSYVIKHLPDNQTVLRLDLSNVLFNKLKPYESRIQADFFEKIKNMLIQNKFLTEICFDYAFISESAAMSLAVGICLTQVKKISLRGCKFENLASRIFILEAALYNPAVKIDLRGSADELQKRILQESPEPSIILEELESEVDEFKKECGILLQKAEATQKELLRLKEIIKFFKSKTDIKKFIPIENSIDSSQSNSSSFSLVRAEKK